MTLLELLRCARDAYLTNPYAHFERAHPHLLPVWTGASEHRRASASAWFDESALLLDLSDDRHLVDRALDLLDRVTPGNDGRSYEVLDRLQPGHTGWNGSVFAFWVRGGEHGVDETGEVIGTFYRYDRGPHEVAAVIGRACALAARAEDGADG